MIDKEMWAYTIVILILSSRQYTSTAETISFCTYTTVHTYNSNKSVKLLLYNYVPNGNLQKLLSENRSLDWEYTVQDRGQDSAAFRRYYTGMSSATTYCSTPSMRPIWLMNPPNYIMPCRVLLVLMGTHCSRVRLHLKNSTEKSNVYSYGLVLLSGRSAIEPMISDSLHIMEWAKKMGSYEPAVNILDPKLRGMADELGQEMLQTVGIAIFCVNPAPGEQPTMKDAVAFHKEVKNPPEEWAKTSQ